MRSKGYDWFNVGEMTSFWKNTLKSRDKYGVYVTNNQWMWYENWIPVIENTVRSYRRIWIVKLKSILSQRCCGRNEKEWILSF